MYFKDQITQKNMDVQQQPPAYEEKSQGSIQVAPVVNQPTGEVFQQQQPLQHQPAVIGHNQPSNQPQQQPVVVGYQPQPMHPLPGGYQQPLPLQPPGSVGYYPQQLQIQPGGYE